MKRFFASLVFLAAAASPAMADNPLIRNLVDCKPDFFDLVLKERTAIGVVIVKSLDERHGGTHETSVSAEFDKPIRDFGLVFTHYNQQTEAMTGSFTTWRWGLVADATPRAVAYALDSYVKKQGKTSDGMGFRREDKIWRVGIGPYKGLEAWRQLIVSPIGDGKKSFLFCQSEGYERLFYSDGRLFDRLPDIGSLFDVREGIPAKP